MKKIPTLFVRDENDRRHVIPEVTPGCEWVLAGEGVATRKWDGTCIKIADDGTFWARREVKPGKPAPGIYLPIETDPVTGKTVGWEPAERSGFAKYIDEAITAVIDLPPGTYELVGPKINGNPDEFDTHRLVRHGRESLALDDRSFAGIEAFVRRFKHMGGHRVLARRVQPGFQHGEDQAPRLPRVGVMNPGTWSGFLLWLIGVGMFYAGARWGFKRGVRFERAQRMLRDAARHERASR